MASLLTAITPSSIIADVELGINLLTGIARGNIINVFTQNGFTPIFANAIPMRASVRETSRVMEYPVETGATLSDHHIINPINIELQMLVAAANYSSTYGQIRNAFINATALSVQTRTGIYKNLIIADMPHDENPDMFDAIMISLHLREAILVVPNSSTQPSNYQPLSPVNANTALLGNIASTLITTGLSVASYANAAKLWGVKL